MPFKQRLDIEVTGKIIKKVATLPAITEGMTFTISTPDQLKKASEFLSQIKKMRSDIDKERKEVKAPILTAGRKIDAEYKPALKLLDDAETVLKAAIKDFETSDHGNTLTQSLPSSHTMVENWTYEIVDEDKIPDEFMVCMPDHEKIKAYVKLMKDTGKIDGVRIFNDPIVRAKKADFANF